MALLVRPAQAPMLARLALSLPDDSGYVFEPKAGFTIPSSDSWPS